MRLFSQNSRIFFSVFILKLYKDNLNYLSENDFFIYYQLLPAVQFIFKFVIVFIVLNLFEKVFRR